MNKNRSIIGWVGNQEWIKYHVAFQKIGRINIMWEDSINDFNIMTDEKRKLIESINNHIALCQSRKNVLIARLIQTSKEIDAHQAIINQLMGLKRG